jgi:hypothetical protein
MPNGATGAQGHSGATARPYGNVGVVLPRRGALACRRPCRAVWQYALFGIMRR